MIQEYKFNEIINGELIKSFTFDNIKGVNDINITHTIEDLENYLEIQFRYKYGDLSFNSFIEFNAHNLNLIASLPITELEFKIQSIGTKEFLLNKFIFDLNTDLTQTQQYISSRNNIVLKTFNPYHLDHYNKIRTQLNSVVSNSYGHCVKYWRTIGDKTTQDIIFKEYTLANVLPHIEIKIVIPDNQLPEDNFEYQAMDMNFFDLPFEIHIPYCTWQEFYPGTTPQQNDIIYITLLNRLYKVNSIYHPLIKTFDAEGYYRLNLVKWENETEYLSFDEEIQNEINELTIGLDDIFGETKSTIQKNIAKDEQNKTHLNKILYKNIHLESIPYELLNKWNIISNNYYDLSHIDNTAVVYDSISIVDSATFSFWINFKTNNQIILNNNNFNIQLIDNKLNIKLNSNIYELGDYIYEQDKWYGITIQLINNYKQCIYNVFINDDSKLIKPQANILNVVYTNQVSISEFELNDINLELLGGNYKFTNFKYFNNYIENINLITAQNIVSDNDNLIIFDQAI